MKAKSIKPVKDFGVTGFQVNFSILDLYRMEQLAIELQQIYIDQVNILGTQNALELTSTMLHNLFKATIGEPSSEWDFLQPNEEPCTK